MIKDIFPLETASSCGKSTQVPDPMQLIQIESLLKKADMLSLVVIMFIAVTRMEVFKSLRRLDISARYAKGHKQIPRFQSTLLCHYFGVSETARFLRTAQTRVSTRTRDSHLISVWKRTVCWSTTSLQKPLNTRWFKAWPLSLQHSIENTFF